MLYNAPGWIRFLIAIAKPFMKQKLKKKISVIKTREELSDHIHDDHLLTSLGGNLDFDTEDFISREFK